MHELDPPRIYKTIIVCGAFGLGSTREQDLEALRRCREHLESGGTLLADNKVPYADTKLWRHWPKDERVSLPEAAEPPRSRSPRRTDPSSRCARGSWRSIRSRSG